MYAFNANMGQYDLVQQSDWHDVQVNLEVSMQERRDRVRGMVKARPKTNKKQTNASISNMLNVVDLLS